MQTELKQLEEGAPIVDHQDHLHMRLQGALQLTTQGRALMYATT